MTRENDELNEKIYQKEKEMKKLLHQSQSESEKVSFMILKCFKCIFNKIYGFYFYFSFL